MQTQDANLEGKVAQSYKTLQNGNVAVIREKSAERTPGPYQFCIEICTVKRYSGEDELRAGIQAKVVDSGSYVPIGKYKGWVGIKPVATDSRFVVLTYQRDSLGDVTLELYDSTSYQNLRSGTIPLDCFEREGFDLDQENLDNHGRVLSSKLSQLLYDFQLGQGQFQQQDKQ